jgi:4-amino-4-deoxy-L-arabinose transferase-like glycosyltransferase
VAGVFLFLAARRAFNDGTAAAAACLMLALNPNLLYLASIPMTEAVFLACLSALLYFSIRFRETQGWGALVGAALASAAASLARYEGWFLIPFTALYFLIAARKKRLAAALVFAGVASLGPLAWLAHNLYYYGNVLEFYNGGSSAKAIYQRALDAHMERYPGDHDWRKALDYLGNAVRLCAGWPLVVLGVAGSAIALLRRALWPLVLLGLVPVFYVLSLHSGGTPIFVPHLWPHAYYNTRYGITALPLLAFAAAALVTLAPGAWKKPLAALVVLGVIAPWIAYPRMEGWICWKESQVNSNARRAWTKQAAEYLRTNYHRGDGILTTVGDVAAVYQEAGIPMRETMNECNGDAWHDLARSARPVPTQKWAVAIAGDQVAGIIARAARSGPRYDLVKVISEKGASPVEIYRRQS